MIDTARALSSASPTLPIDADSPCSVRDSVNLTDVYLLPAPTSAIRHRRSTTEFAAAISPAPQRPWSCTAPDHCDGFDLRPPPTATRTPPLMAIP
jgi:hypothetical protein